MKEGGYEDPQGAKGDPIYVTFRVEHYKTQHTSSGINARFMRNGEPVGMLHLKSEKELEILKRHIDGSYNLDTGAFTLVNWEVPG